VDLAATGGHGHLERVGDQRGAHVIRDRPADKRRQQISMTVARYSQVKPTATYVVSRHHVVLGMSALKSRLTRSGTGRAVLPSMAVRFVRRMCR
jgi:hypothetical protein